MKCSECGEDILPGEHVYVKIRRLIHAKCHKGRFPAVMGSDGVVRWCPGSNITSCLDNKQVFCVNY